MKEKYNPLPYRTTQGVWWVIKEENLFPPPFLFQSLLCYSATLDALLLCLWTLLPIDPFPHHLSRQIMITFTTLPNRYLLFGRGRPWCSAFAFRALRADDVREEDGAYNPSASQKGIRRRRITTASPKENTNQVS